MPDESTLYAYLKSSGRKLTWVKVQSIAYSDVVQYNGETYRNDLVAYMTPNTTDSGALSGKGYAYLWSSESGGSGANPSIPDPVQDAIDGSVPPREKPQKYSIATLTVTHGTSTMAITVRLDELDGGTFFKEA